MTGMMIGAEGKRTMMAPSVSYFGGIGGDADEAGSGSFGRAGIGAAFAFVRGIRFRRRTASVGVASSTARLSSSPSLAGDGSFHPGGNRAQQQLQRDDRIPRPDEPNLFEIPSHLRATYRPLSILFHLVIVIASALLVQRRELSLSLVRQLHQTISVSVLRRAFSFLLRTLLVSTIARLAIQEVFSPPSRISTQHLAERGNLPSQLSRYRTVVPLALPVPKTTQSSCVEGVEGAPLTSTRSWLEKEKKEGGALAMPIGVHSIQCTNQNAATSKNDDRKHKYDGIYLYHGFGASSLSWLPILPSLVNRLGRSGEGGGRPAVGVAHDAPGFGFTDRPTTDGERGMEQYGSEHNAGIGITLLKEAASVSSQSSEQSLAREAITDRGEQTAGEEDGAEVAIFGHSMGSKAALLMALRCSQYTQLKLRPRLVVLVAPALVGVSLGTPKNRSMKSSQHQQHTKAKSNWITKSTRKVLTAWKNIFLHLPFRRTVAAFATSGAVYGLRRLVG